MRASIVFDVGGTFIRAGVFSEKNGLAPKIIKVESPNFLSIQLSDKELLESFITTIKNIVSKLIIDNSSYNITDIGISFPGPITLNGEIISAPTLWGDLIKNYPLKTELQKKLPQYNISVINDITAAGWRYINNFNGTFCVITISSGVGCKVFWNKQLLINDNGLGGELGHHYYKSSYSNILCDCGENGHIGSISSGRGIEKLAKFLIAQEHISSKNSILLTKEKITTYDIVDAINKKDKFSLYLLKESIKPIVDSISCLYAFIGLNKYIFIGGFASAIGNIYTDFIKEELLKQNLMGLSSNDIDSMIILGETDDNNGLIGMGNYLQQVSN